MAIRATDPQGAISDAVMVKVNVIDLNENPWLTYHSVGVREQTAVGSELAPRLQGEDVDFRNSILHRSNLEYTIVSKPAGLSWVSLRTDGTLVLSAEAPSFTSSVTKSWNMTVQVEDPQGLTGQGTVNVRLLDSNFNPDVTSRALTFPESTPTSTTLLDGRQASVTPMGTDQDNDVL